MLRARIILQAAKGRSNRHIAGKLGCDIQTVRKWRHRFSHDSRVESLVDLPRRGRPPQVPVEVRCTLIKLACSRPDRKSMPFLAAWTRRDLQDALHLDTGFRLSRSEIGRILNAEGVRPHRIRQWLHSPDPEFAPKVRAICRWYLHPPPGMTILCIDEKTGMQALERKYPGRPASPGQDSRREFEYIRHGTATMIAGFDIRTGQVLAHCGQTRKADDLMAFMEMVADRCPGRVGVVWDNLNIHHGDRWIDFNERHENRFEFRYTPIHASWMNQIEVWFSIFQRNVLKHGSFESSDRLIQISQQYIRYWNRAKAHPFNWRFRGSLKSRGMRLAA